jgi:hypothetical protein
MEQSMSNQSHRQAREHLAAAPVPRVNLRILHASQRSVCTLKNRQRSFTPLQNGNGPTAASFVSI